MDIKQEFREEKNMDVYATNVNDGSFSNVYVKWLEAKLTLTDVGKGTELLPDFLYKDDYGIKIGYHGDTEVSKEWNEYLEKIR
jgi:hypothetical protein